MHARLLALLLLAGNTVACSIGTDGARPSDAPANDAGADDGAAVAPRGPDSGNAPGETGDATSPARDDASAPGDAAMDAPHHGTAEASVDAAAPVAPAAPCAFASGLNVAWVKFANDVPNPDLATFKAIFDATHAAGGRVVRWWLHTNGTVTPGYLPSGLVQPLPQAHVDGIRSVLDTAHASGVALVISLWSFDMLQSNAGSTYVQNTALLEQDAVRQSYVDAYLTPLVKALHGHPALYAYEIFNEPEGMTPSGWATYRVDESVVQKTVNWFAAGIHDADPTALVTNGSQQFQYSSNVSGKTNFYSDAALRSAGGKASGTLDFYEVHYYASNGASNSCFLQPASHWGLDKKLVMGEFFAAATDGVAQNDTYTSLFDHGYDGAWAWSYESDQPWPSMQVPMQNLYAAHAATVGACAPHAGAKAVETETADEANTSVPTATRSAAEVEGARRLAREEALRATQGIHALAAEGRSSEARGAAEDMVNRYPDSPIVREIERFTGAHRRRNLRRAANGAIESY